MGYNSYIFIFLFFPLFLLSWSILRGHRRLRLSLIIIGSYIFYAWWDFRFTALLVFMTGINYLAGRRIHFARSVTTRRAAAILAVCFSLAPLFFFKYFPWLGSYARFFLEGTIKSDYNAFISNIILPVGISFFTFQALTYTIDLYLGKCDFCNDPLKFSAFVCMFPQLLAGPITRFRFLDSQLDRVHQLDDQVDYPSAMSQFFQGLIKKVLLADQLGILINPYFLPEAQLSPNLAWIAIVGYSLQIYFDFSGYSDMAIGIGRALGFALPVNFRTPYLASNPVDFWRRWHISLSTWFRDYVYIPLGGNRSGRNRTYWNLFVTMIVAGVWHGASWNFVLWGAWHGLNLVLYKIIPVRVRAFIPYWLGVLFTNLAVVIGWTFFRLHDMENIFTFLGIMFGLGPVAHVTIPWLLFLLLPVGIASHFFEKNERLDLLRTSYTYAILLCGLSVFGILELGRDTPFIYFQF